jgi:hypothetical protein
MYTSFTIFVNIMIKLNFIPVHVYKKYAAYLNLLTPA